MASRSGAQPQPPTGHVYRVDRQRGPQGYAKYRLPDGRQKQRIGPAWTERGRPATGYYTKRTAEAWLRDLLEQVRRGTLPGLVQTGATFEDAAAEWLRYLHYAPRKEDAALVASAFEVDAPEAPTTGLPSRM
jgi:hypothetical protein